MIEKGYISLVPYKSKFGDRIIVLFGGYTAFMLKDRSRLARRGDGVCLGSVVFMDSWMGRRWNLNIGE